MQRPAYVPLPELMEEKRIAALHELQLLDTDPEEEFDELVALAAELCGAPQSVMTLVDSHRQFDKSCFGLQRRTTVRSDAFCNYTIQQPQTFIVPDARQDGRFRENPQVTGEAGLCFYAGHPLRTADGHAVGALCVMDTQPRELSSVQERMLRVIANQLSIRVQMRSHARAVQKLNEELDGERKLFRAFLDSIPVETYLKNQQGQLLFYNKAVAERFGVTQEAWLGKTSGELWAKEIAEGIMAEERNVIETGKSHTSYVAIPCHDGVTEYWKTIKSPIQRATGEVMLANISLNMTEDLRREEALQHAQDELEEANQKLRSLSLTDNLTGLWNRRAFDSHVETEVFRAQHGCTPLTLLMIDVDNFKRLNDDFGHSHGDDVLRQVAAILSKSVRSNDIAVRFGGEEFAVVMPGTNIEIAQAVCARIQRALKDHAWMHREVTVSIGVADCVADITADDLLKMADCAMYRAKRSGKDRAVAYDASLLAHTVEPQGATVMQ